MRLQSGQIKTKKVIKALRRHQWVMERGKGAHLIFKTPTNKTFSLSYSGNSREISVCILRSKLKEIGYDLDVLMAPVAKKEIEEETPKSLTIIQKEEKMSENKPEYPPTREVFARMIVECFKVDIHRAESMAIRSASKSAEHGREGIANNSLFKVCHWMLTNKEEVKEVHSYKTLLKRMSRETGVLASYIGRYFKQGMTFPHGINLPTSKREASGVEAPGVATPPKEAIKEVAKHKPLKAVYNLLFQLAGIKSSIPAGGEHTGLLHRFHRLEEDINLLLQEEREEIERRLT